MDTPWIGDGSIKPDKRARFKGKWRLQWTIIVDGAEQQVDKVFALKGDATGWRDEKKVALRTGARVDLAKSKAKAHLTVQGMWDELAGTKAKDFRDGKLVKDGATTQTVMVKWYRWDKWVKGSPIAVRPMRLVNRDDARAHVERMKAAGASIATMRDVLGVLKLVANKAVDEKPECKSLANPFVRISLQSDEEAALAAKERAEREAVEGPPLIVLSPGAAFEGLRKIEDLRLKAMLAVHLLGGLRSGERGALEIEQLDFDAGVIVIDRAVRLDASQRSYVGLPKRNKIRLVAMCPTLARILREYVEAMPEGRTLLFGGERRGKIKRKSRTYDEWRAAVKAAGLPEGLIPKGCRRSHNNWIEKLCPTVSVSTRLEHMGHSLSRGDGQPMGMGVNIRNYTAYIPEAYDVLRAEIERVVGADSGRGSHLHLAA